MAIISIMPPTMPIIVYRAMCRAGVCVYQQVRNSHSGRSIVPPDVVDCHSMNITLTLAYNMKPITGATIKISKAIGFH
jgi:hypothetical protein